MRMRRKARTLKRMNFLNHGTSQCHVGLTKMRHVHFLMLKRKETAHCVDRSTPPMETVMSSPETGEFRSEAYGDDSARSSGSIDRGSVLGPSDGSESSGKALIINEYMENDEKLRSSADSGQQGSDSASEEYHSSQSLKPPFLTERSTDMLQGCRSVFEYEKLNKINEGTYGVVYRARDKKTGDIVALKKVKMGVERDGFPLSALREINILLSLKHPSIVNVKEVVMGDLNNVFMVMEYMEHDLKELLEVMQQSFSISEIKCLMLQLLEGVKYLHDNWVLHRDLKSSNILMSDNGELKICDFGMSRQYGSVLKPYTSLVVTLWYRAPELLLGLKEYSTAVDMWSVGCVMAEKLLKEPLFKGKSEIDQLDKIFRTLGTPSEVNWPGFSSLSGSKPIFIKQPYNLLRKKFPAASFTGTPALSDSGLDLLNRLLMYDPEKAQACARCQQDFSGYYFCP